MKRGRKFFHPESYRLFTLSLVFFERKEKKEGRKGSRLNEITSGGKFDSIHLAYPVATNDNFRACLELWPTGTSRRPTPEIVEEGRSDRIEWLVGTILLSFHRDLETALQVSEN